MITTSLQLAQEELGTRGLQEWIVNNMVPLLLLTVAILLLWLGGGRGDNAGVMRRLGGVFVALAIIGLAVTGSGVGIGKWIASLFSG
ncbi:hypothetical protein GCM10012275_38830 [Longimycelium tulufanense]|uniref:Uncharacterized protein n=1 Tax=Longimycelium tulufanense TaxID=907463 RepID=A0A8J3FXP4_9PSEU|nr:hypothetical protein [Longimycelium tulufanense]GGM64451.1 hypothetical protein GCM10012275_38830 [Longimycelium tulufanense]